ncbi:MAG: DUF6438 domain-containing protein [Lysobacter sp.]
MQLLQTGAIGLSMLLAGSPNTADTPARPGVAAVPACSAQQLYGLAPENDEIRAHRLESTPIDYRFDTQRNRWGLRVTLRVDEQGRVVCFDNSDPGGNWKKIDRGHLVALAHLRYRPFLDKGVAVPAIVEDRIDEQERPATHVPLPQVALADVRIALERTACFGSCPSYRVEIGGDGQVVYQGRDYVDVRGRHAYRIPVEAVAGLVESLRTRDLWSLRPSYRASITDNPTYLLTLRMGDQTHFIADYVGEEAGMPVVVSEFEDEVDRVSGARSWVNLSGDAVERLRVEGFDFGSRESANILARAIGNRDRSDEAGMRRMIALGAPLDGGDPDEGRPRSPESLLEIALRNRRETVAAALIEKDALKTAGKNDPAKIDAAFRAAIAGGRMNAVQSIWNVAGDGTRPSLWFSESTGGDHPTDQRVPVSLMLCSWLQRTQGGDGLEIARWLAGQGVDLKARAADGHTLLHVAARAGDVEFVRYLLDQGVDPSAVGGGYGSQALRVASNEEVAMLLVEASPKVSDLSYYTEHAKEQRWGRVLQWLKTHGQTR